MTTTIINNYINHICLVLDESSSMHHLRSDVIKVADNQIAWLAQRSKEMGQETRITVYAFASRGTARCLIYDKDVLRMPSIAQFYYPHGNTALIDATVLAIDDLKLTPEKYGEHAFLLYVLTDGEENHSLARPGDLTSRITGLPDHWTVAVFVPNQAGKFEAKRWGFPADNIAVWDATTVRGLEEAGLVMRQATENFMQARTRGVRGSRNLFQLKDVSATEVRKALVPITRGSFFFEKIDADTPIDQFCKAHYGRYDVGKAYYQLTGKPVIIQGTKEIAIETSDGTLYSGPMRDVRSLLGLPDHEEKVRPTAQKDMTVFVQSTSFNRKLLAGTRLLVFR